MEVALIGVDERETHELHIPRGTLQVIRAEVPMSEMLSFDADLTSMTGGRGSYSMEMSHYAELPAHLQEKVVAATKAERGVEKEEEA